jgi:hypothetical protein
MDDIHLTVDGKNSPWMGNTYGCPYCHKIISAEMSPAHLRKEIVAALKP